MEKVLIRIGLAAILLSWTALSACATASPSEASDKRPAGAKSGFITTTDGLKIHYLEAGHQKSFPTAEVGNPLPAGTVATKGNISVTNPNQFPSILFIPGWTMPAWIWEKQIEYFTKDYRVVAMDPRSQGESSQTPEGLYPAVRARDIKAVVDKLHMAPVVLVGWSMGVTEVAAYLDQFGSGDLAGVVLVDGYAGGTDSVRAPRSLALLKSVLEDRQNTTSQFIRTVFFKKPQSEEYLNRVIHASLITPTEAAVALLVGMYGTDYKLALVKNTKPTLICAAKSLFTAEMEDLHKQIPPARYETFDDAGHALFVDDADKFNALLEDFLHDLLLR
jgi:non-heme chloroperoxidase